MKARPLASLALSLATAAAACTADDPGQDPEAMPDPGSEDPADPAPTYYQDVEPILYTHCVSCHSDGGIAPFPLDDADSALGSAGFIAHVTAERIMPPWPPGPLSAPLRHERRLTDEQIDTLAAWVEAGTPLGDPDAPGPRVEPDVVDIGEPELSFDIGVDYVPDASVSDDYRCFAVPLDADTTRTATGYRVVPGNPKIVHHVITRLYRAQDLPTLQALDAETPDRPGWPCFAGAVPQGTPVQAVGTIGSWVPGVSAVAYPEGTGNVVPAGSVAVIQVHYNLAGGLDPDRTRFEVALAPEGTQLTALRSIGMFVRQLDIKAGQERAEFENTFTAEQWMSVRGQPLGDGDGYIVATGAHAHLLATEVELLVNGDPVLSIPRWDFHWQGSYQLAEPIRVVSSDELTLRCVYDNSDAYRAEQGLGPGVDVTWGEGTEDEMCLGNFTIVDELP